MDSLRDLIGSIDQGEPWELINLAICERCGQEENVTTIAIAYEFQFGKVDIVRNVKLCAFCADLSAKTKQEHGL